LFADKFLTIAAFHSNHPIAYPWRERMAIAEPQASAKSRNEITLHFVARRSRLAPTVPWQPPSLKLLGIGNVTKRDDVQWALSLGTQISPHTIGSWDLTRA
jgi:hypothetical protein